MQDLPKVERSELIQKLSGKLCVAAAGDIMETRCRFGDAMEETRDASCLPCTRTEGLNPLLGESGEEVKPTSRATRSFGWRILLRSSTCRISFGICVGRLSVNKF